MDNYFYDRKRKQTKDSTQSPMTRLVVVQLVLSLLVSGLLFLVCKSESALAGEIKALYREKCETDITASTVIDVFRGVVRETLSPDITE